MYRVKNILGDNQGNDIHEVVVKMHIPCMYELPCTNFFRTLILSQKDYSVCGYTDMSCKPKKTGKRLIQKLVGTMVTHNKTKMKKIVQR